MLPNIGPSDQLQKYDNEKPTSKKAYFVNINLNTSDISPKLRFASAKYF